MRSAVDNIAQLSGRGFPHIFHIKLCCRKFMFFGAPKWTPGRVVLDKYKFSMCLKQPTLYIVLFIFILYFVLLDIVLFS